MAVLVDNNLNMVNAFRDRRPEVTEATTGIRQWVSEVVNFSSQYNDTTWSANQVIGPPRVYPNYGDLQQTWAQSTFTQNEFIEIKFPEQVYVTGINIYETLHSGAIIRIRLKDFLRNKWVTAWQSVQGPIDLGTSRIFSPDLEPTFFKTNHVRLELDCSFSNSYCEIDAVELIGKKFSVDVVNSEECLANDLKFLLKNEEFSDIKFEVNGKIMSAHRNILTARSEYFRTLLCENLSADRLSRPVHIDNMSTEAFSSLLHYFYTNSIEDSTDSEIACELMRISDWYNLDELKTVAFNFIERKLCLDNVVRILINAMTIEPRLESVKMMCLKYTTKNFVSLIDRTEFKNLPQFILVQITQYYAQFCKPA